MSDQTDWEDLIEQHLRGELDETSQCSTRTWFEVHCPRNFGQEDRCLFWCQRVTSQW